MALPTFTAEDETCYPWWHDRLPDLPEWMRGHLIWDRSYGRRFWPVPAKRSMMR